MNAKDADSDFFEAGGNSLTAIRLISQAEESFGEDVLPPEDLFAESSVRQIAATILRNARG
nr:phosphopantetheine-binding protein [Streptomonospora nanhaiensis]